MLDLKDYIENYLKNISEIINVSKEKLIFARQEKNKFINILNNPTLDYTKPDEGYGSEINTFGVFMETKKEFYQTRIDNKPYDLILSFGLYEFPSCCAFCVSTQAYTSPKYQSRGLNKLSNKLRQKIAKFWDYSAIICTDVEQNIAERKTLQSENFEDIFKIKNKRTGNNVFISVKKLE